MLTWAPRSGPGLSGPGPLPDLARSRTGACDPRRARLGHVVRLGMRLTSSPLWAGNDRLGPGPVVGSLLALPEPYVRGRPPSPVGWAR